MNHILNISFDFDETSIKRTVEEQASRQIIGDMKDDIERTMYRHKWGRDTDNSPNARNGLADFILERFDEFIKENKEAIIAEAVNEAVKKLVRTKAVGDAVDRIIREVERHEES